MTRSLAEEGHAMRVVAHEVGFAREVSSRVMFLHDGRGDENGKPEEVFDRPRFERFKQFLAGTFK